MDLLLVYYTHVLNKNTVADLCKNSVDLGNFASLQGRRCYEQKFSKLLLLSMIFWYFNEYKYIIIFLLLNKSIVVVAILCKNSVDSSLT